MRGSPLIRCACLLAGGLLSRAALAQPARMAPRDAARLEPGSIQPITWSLGADSEAFDEMELVLSLDGGRTFPLRVTRRIAPDASVWLWEVPALPAEHARLGLRVGSDQPAAEERIALVSGEFSIAAPPSASLEEIFSVAGESRTRAAMDDPASPTLPDTAFRTGLDGGLAAEPVYEPTPRRGHGIAGPRDRSAGETAEGAAPVLRNRGLRPTARPPVLLPMRL